MQDLATDYPKSCKSSQLNLYKENKDRPTLLNPVQNPDPQSMMSQKAPYI